MAPLVLAEGVCLLLPALAVDVVTLAVATFAFGAVHGTLNIVMNTNAVEVEQRLAAPIRPRRSTPAPQPRRVPRRRHRRPVRPCRCRTDRHVPRGRRRGHRVGAVGRPVGAAFRTCPRSDARAGRQSTTERGAGHALLGVLVFCCLVGEGAAADWSAVYLRDNLGSGAGFAAAAYAAFSVMMLAGRMVGDRLAARSGRCVGTCRWRSSPRSGWAGAPDRPADRGRGRLRPARRGTVGHSAAGLFSRRQPRSGSGRPALARVASVGFLGFVIGPVVIGAVAEVVGLPAALTVPVVLALFVAGTASVLGRR